MSAQDSCCLATKTGAQYKYLCGPKSQTTPYTLDATYGKDPLTSIASNLLYNNEGYIFKCPDYSVDTATKTTSLSA